MRGVLVEWVASLLLAAWQRQEVEGRYRGSDDFRALHIDPADALASWQATSRPQVPWPAELRIWFDEWAPAWFDAEALGLDDADRLVAALALAVELEPRLRPLVAALGDDPSRRLVTVGLAVEMAGALGLEEPAVRRACASTARLAWLDVIRVVTAPDRPSPLDAELVASAWLIDPAAAPLPRSSSLLEIVPRTGRSRPPGTISADEVRTAVVHLHGADHTWHAEHAARVLGRDAVVLVEVAEEAEVGRAAREAMLAHAALVVRADGAPPVWLPAALERAHALGVPTALSLTARWVAPATWREIGVAPLSTSERAERWAAALPDAAPADLAHVAAEFVLGADDVDDAARRVRSGGSPDLATLRTAARSTTWQDLTTVARPGPTGVGWDDLVVPTAVASQLHEIAGAVAQRGAVLDGWGFGARPGGRGYHLLFAGPSGTGKTLAAAVVAGEVGRELWVVDLARVVDKYLGETEKQLDKVLRAGEASGAMLLFDEADALFGRRGEVHEARDRWANVEVAYLLQRIEDHDGVTVLTTNLGQNLDEAFARRISQRVEFAVPDAGLRRRLWRMSVPADAPLADELDLLTVADRFELAGGAIRTAALNAAYEAAADRAAIELGHLVRGCVRELTKAGRPPTRGQLADLAPLVGAR